MIQVGRATIFALWVASSLSHAFNIDEPLVGAYSFRGNFTHDNEEYHVSFAPGYAVTLYIVSYGYGGGVQADGTEIPRGGLASHVTLFDETDGNYDGSPGDATCFEEAQALAPRSGSGNTDPNTGAIFDSCVKVQLDGGSGWLAVLSQYGHYYIGGGWNEIDTSTYPECTQAAFCDETATPVYTNRSSQWAFDIIAVPDIVCGKRWYRGIGEDGIQADGAHPAAMYESIATVCSTQDGLCSGTYDGVDITGWLWASIDEVGSLFAHFSPHPGGIATYEARNTHLPGKIMAVLGYVSYDSDGITWDAITRTPYGPGFSGYRAALWEDWQGAGPDCISTDLATATACRIGGHQVPLFQAVERDIDFDGIDDANDNCVISRPWWDEWTNNPDQRDTDGDGIGNLCDPDFNGDYRVNFADLSVMKSAFFSNPSSPNWNPDADLDGDDSVDFADLPIFRRYFFGTPGPSCVVP